MPRVISHAVPLTGPLSQSAAAELMVLLREPRDEARAEGSRAYFTGEPCKYETGTPEQINWQVGWDYERGQDS